MSEDDPLAVADDEAVDGDDADDDASFRQRHPNVVKWGTIVGLVVISVVSLYGVIEVFGVLNGLAYYMLFLLGATLLPMLTLLLFDMTPNLIAKLYFLLGQLAYGRPWLVQHDHGWEMHPGRQEDGTEQVYIDGVWYDVPDTEHQTILGWQRFGILLDKTDDDALEAYRVEDELKAADSDDGLDDETVERLASLEPEDLAAMDRDDLEALTAGNGAVADGGEETVVRGGVPEIKPTVDEDDDRWWIDLKRVWSSGLEQMGDIELIERVEEVTMREEAASDSADRRRMYALTAFGLILGILTGFVAMLGF